MDKMLNCPMGYYCPNSRMKDPIICRKGFYCPDENMNLLISCPKEHIAHMDLLDQIYVPLDFIVLKILLQNHIDVRKVCIVQMR